MTVESLIGSVVDYSIRRPWLVVGTAAFLLLLSLLSLPSIELKTSNLDLIDPDLPEIKRFLEVTNSFGTPNILIVVLEGENPDELRKAVDELGPRLQKNRGVRQVIYKLPWKDIRNFGSSLIFMDADDGKQKYRQDGLPDFKKHSHSGDAKTYLASRDNQLFFILVQPDDSRSQVSSIAPFISEVRETLDAVKDGNPHVKIGITGIPVYALDDRDIIQNDIKKLTVLSLLLVFTLFVFGFRKLRRPLLAVLALVVGVVITLGLISIFPGHLTLLSASFASILIGLGIDYGIHAVHHVEEKLDEGLNERDSIRLGFQTVGRSLLAGASTTAAVFFTLTVSGFLGFRELGIIAGTGVFICLLVMLTLLPALLTIFNGSTPAVTGDNDFTRGSRLLLLARSKIILGCCFLFSVIAMVAGHPKFDSNYLNLQPRDSETVKLERDLVQRSDFSPQFAVFETDSLAKAADIADLLRKTDCVRTIWSITDHLPESLWGQPFIETIRNRFENFISSEGNYAVYAFPVGNVWEDTINKHFIDTMRQIDENVTGMPFVGSFMISETKKAMRKAATLSAIILLVVVGLNFLDFRYTILTVIPTFLSLIWMNGIMHLLGMSYNPINIMALPIVIGIAVDDGVHIVNRFRIEQGNLEKTISGTGRSVLLTSLTTIAAFGTLALTSHRGLRSFSLTLTIGVASAMILSLTILPFLLDLFGRSSTSMLSKTDTV